jgi:hypothetical protein
MGELDIARLSKWTPISFRSDPEPALIWADLRAYRFEEPFFHRTIAKWRRSAAVATESTGLAALRALDTSPSLDPCLIIAHGARCGSTLLARTMGAMDGALTISEPNVPFELLSYGLRRPHDFPVRDVLRQAVRALGRVRFGNERRFVLKLSSAMTRFLPQFRLAFPGVPMIWLQRRPAEIVASEIRRPSAWVDFNAQTGRDLATQVLSKTTVVFLAASALVNDDMLVLDYRDLPDAAWTKVAPFIGATLTPPELARMKDRAGFDSKSGKPFEPREPQELPEPVRKIVEQALDPLYAALDRRRGTGPS